MQPAHAENVFKPEPLSIKKLRIHFQNVYQLNASQVEIMVESSSKSLNLAMENIDEYLAGKKVYSKLGSVFHNLKGVSLNMGEETWADFFRIIEKRIAAEEECDISRVKDIMSRGLADILSYCRNKM